MNFKVTLFAQLLYQEEYNNRRGIFASKLSALNLLMLFLPDNVTDGNGGAINCY